MSKFLLPLSACLLLGCGGHAAAGSPAPASPASAAVEIKSTGFVPDANMARSDLPEDSKWKRAPLFASDADFEAADKETAANVQARAAMKGTLSDPANLSKCLKLYFSTRLTANRMTLYAQTRLVTDQKSPEKNAMNDRALSRFADFMAGTAFIRQEILAYSPEALEKAIASDDVLKENAPYLHEIHRRKARVLTPEAERILGLAGDNLWAEIDLNELPGQHEKTFDAVMGDIKWPTITDAEGKEVQLTLSNYAVYRASPDRRVRKETVEKFFGTLHQFQDTLAATLVGQLSQNVLFARARGYNTALEAYLDKDNIDTAIYTSLISSINENLKPLHRYVALRKKVMGLDELHFYDLYTRMIPSSEVKYSFDDAREILPKALAPLGESYISVLKTALDPKEGWIDLYPHQNKESGAFFLSGILCPVVN